MQWLKSFEKEIADFCGVAHAVALNSGTDALTLSLRALGVGPGDEVITAPNSHFASASCIVHVGARPVFADVAEDHNIDPGEIEKAITSRTKAIIPVHLTGRIADMDRINAIAARHNIFVLEDASQAIGSSYNGNMAGSLGHVAAFSAHPLKVLNAAGDAGYITTNDKKIAERVGRLRHHGLRRRNTVLEWGYVSRMDVLQCEILRIRLAKLPAIINARVKNAALYDKYITSDKIQVPAFSKSERCSFHLYVIQLDQRDGLQTYLEKAGISSLVHYPIPLHLQLPARPYGYRMGDLPVSERQAGRILSLPVHQYLSELDIVRVANTISEWAA